MKNIKLTITVEYKGITYQSDEGESFDDIPEMVKSVKQLLIKDINKEKNES